MITRVLLAITRVLLAITIVLLAITRVLLVITRVQYSMYNGPLVYCTVGVRLF